MPAHEEIEGSILMSRSAIDHYFRYSGYAAGEIDPYEAALLISYLHQLR